MDIRVAVGCNALYILMDVVVTTLIYTHASSLSIFKKDLLNFTVLQSMVDLWGVVLLRVALLLGACIGVSWNREDGPPRVLKLTSFVVFLCLIVITYTLAKLLMLTELGPLTQQPWVLSLICWTFASTLGVLLPWTLLGKQTKSAGSRSRGRGSSDDTEKLVESGDNNEEEEEDGSSEREKSGGEGKQQKKKQQQTSSSATLGRLLSYCRKDGGLLSVAVLFLLISAVCEWPRRTQQ